MKTYSVKEISKITGANEETVRRWFRNGKLPKGQSIQGKDKYVSELDLIDFLRKTPKYMTSAVNYFSKFIADNSDNILIGAAIGLVGGGLLALLSEEKENTSEMEAKVAKTAITTEIQLSENEINKKILEIEKLEKEIEEEKKYLDTLRNKEKEVFND